MSGRRPVPFASRRLFRVLSHMSQFSWTLVPRTVYRRRTIVEPFAVIHFLYACTRVCSRLTATRAAWADIGKLSVFCASTGTSTTAGPTGSGIGAGGWVDAGGRVADPAGRAGATAGAATGRAAGACEAAGTAG